MPSVVASFFAVGRDLRASSDRPEGPLAALDDRPRPGKKPMITPEAKARLADLGCRKALISKGRVRDD